MGKLEKNMVSELRSDTGDRRQDSSWDIRPETGDRRQRTADRRERHEVQSHAK